MTAFPDGMGDLLVNVRNIYEDWTHDRKYEYYIFLEKV